MKCKVVILGEDKTQNHSCVGELILSGKMFSLSYIFEGDSCLLTYDGEILQHEKKGEIPVYMQFIENKSTLCKVGEGEYRFEIPVFTNCLKVQTDPKSVNIEIVYELAGEDKRMQIFAESLA